MAYQKILHAPQAGVADGFQQMAALLAATLGPNRGVIWNTVGAGKPEQLTDSGVIARRVTDLRGEAQNTGAMLLRQAAQTMHTRYLDGAATTGVLAEALIAGAARLIAAGYNPMVLRRGVERGVRAAGAALQAQARPVDDQQTLKQLAFTAIGDGELADVLGEMFDVLGKYGAYVVEEYAAPYLDREYMDGGRWSARPGARELMPPGGADLTLEQPVILVTDEKLERLAQIRPALEIVSQMPGKPPLLIVARDVTGEALNALTLNHTRGAFTAGVAVFLSAASQLAADLEDLSLLVGGQLVAAAVGTPPERLRVEWLGRARQIILKRDSLTVIGGGGDRVAMGRRVTDLRGQLRRLPEPNDEWERLRLRTARLSGGLGILKVGALTFQERDARKALAKKAVRVLETALEGGIVPGGGVAYLNTVAAVQSAKRGSDGEDAGIELVARALSAPFLQIVGNHGRIHPAVALLDVQDKGSGFGLNAQTGKYANMVRSGIIDSAPILSAALETAASAAIMAMTTDVILVQK